jgi:amidase
VSAILGEVDLLARPTLIAQPPLSTDSAGFPLTRLTAPFNLAASPRCPCPYRHRASRCP